MYKLILITITMIFVSSCTTVNPYSKFYKQIYQETLPPSSEVELITVAPDEVSKKIGELISQRYLPIGESSFNGAGSDTGLALKYAKEIGAEVVIITQEFTGTKTISSASYVPNVGVIPSVSTVKRFDQNAIYFVKNLTRLRFGVYFEVLTSKEKSRNDIKHGLKVTSVVKGYPASKFGILSGDILLKMDGRKLVKPKDFNSPDNEAIFKVLRKKKELNIRVIIKD